MIRASTELIRKVKAFWPAQPGRFSRSGDMKSEAQTPLLAEVGKQPGPGGGVRREVARGGAAGPATAVVIAVISIGPQVLICVLGSPPSKMPRTRQPWEPKRSNTKQPSGRGAAAAATAMGCAALGVWTCRPSLRAAQPQRNMSMVAKVSRIVFIAWFAQERKSSDLRLSRKLRPGARRTD